MSRQEYAMPISVRWFSVTTAFALGLGYAFGPSSFSNAEVFFYIKQASWFPIQAWGVMFMLCGALLVKTAVAGYFLSTVVWSIWGILLLLAAFTGHLDVWGNIIWPFFFVAINARHVAQWGWHRRDLVREEGISGYRQVRQRPRREGR